MFKFRVISILKICESAAVDVGSIHDDGVLYLGVAYSGVVADCCVGAYVGVSPMVQWSPMMAGSLMVPWL